MPSTPPPSPHIAQLLAQAEAAWNAGELERCEQLARQTLSQWPESAMAWNLLGMVASRYGQLEQAAQLMTQAAKLDATQAQIRTNLAIVLSQLGELAQASALLAQTLEFAPEHETAWQLLAQLLEMQGQFAEQADVLRQAHARCPGSLTLQLMLSDALNTMGEHVQAAKLAADVTHRYPKFADGWSCLGCAQEKLGQIDAARQSLQRAIALKPQEGQLHVNLAHLELLAGNFADGWREYEWRFSCQQSAPLPNLAAPRWQGEPINGKVLLLWPEQGHGDTLQFCRYAQLLAVHGARVWLVCVPALWPLLAQGAPGIERLLPPEQAAAEAGQVDFWAPLLSLPHLTESGDDPLGYLTPYLHVEPQRQARWRARLDALPPGRRIGLIWSGNPLNGNNPTRALPRAQLAALAGLDNVQWISLQMGAEGRQAPPEGLSWHAWGDEIADFADTAAIVSQLDLLISTDTGPAHLAGALGAPTWLLVQRVPDWRWGLSGEQCASYPSMRLFRQREQGDWASVMRAVRAALLAG